ncbi:tetratricopeptide repeat protein [Terriglobus roseus]|nr:tetratricopeptide repeat protein [Terriglobus roseus]
MRPAAAMAATDEETHAQARKTYTDKIAATYNFRYGKDLPFMPSNMTTDNGQFIDPKDFPTAQYCGHCHQEAHQQWRESAHSNANRAPWYLKNVNLLNDSKGIEFSRHCEGCHDPIAMTAGVLTQGGTKKRPYDQDGVTCSVCHSIQKVDARGTGSYVLAPAAVLLDEDGQPIHRKVSDIEILSHLDRHKAAVMKPFYRTSEMCAACHKAALPHELNDYKWQRAMTPYDEWQNSSFAKESPLPFYVKPAVSNCGTCHMPREALTGRDPGAKEGKLASHRWLGANTLIPTYYNYPEQLRRVKEFLENGVFNVDLFALDVDGQPQIAPLGRKPFRLKGGERVTVSVVIQNKGIAHSHVPEQRDMYESWVQFTVSTADGKIVKQSGEIEPGGDLDPAAHSFTNRLVNNTSTLNDLHQVWNNRVVAYNNGLQSGRSQVVRYCFTMPAGTKGPLSVTATVRYRRFDQHFINFALKPGYNQPIVDMVSTTRIFSLGENPSVQPLKDENPEWMRWNNYGVALLDAQQYAASVHAFQQVARLRPDYADAFTNIGIANIQWEKYEDALPSLNKALSLAPNNARALYYLALIERNEGQVSEAIANLKKVEEQFPRSRDAHRELGFSYYQQHRYDEAREEYEKVQSIDPDDLAAHYNLAILYRRLGMKEQATKQAAYFADQKDDPTASTYALDYLRKHGEIAQESVPWHIHDLDAQGKTIANTTLTEGMLPSQQTP